MIDIYFLSEQTIWKFPFETLVRKRGMGTTDLFWELDRMTVEKSEVIFKMLRAQSYLRDRIKTKLFLFTSKPKLGLFKNKIGFNLLSHENT